VLQVVEHEADRRLRSRGRGDQPTALADDEDAAVDGRDLDLRDVREAARLARALGLLDEAPRAVGEPPAAPLVVEGRRDDAAVAIQDRHPLDLRGDLRQVGERLGRVHAPEHTAAQCARSSRSSSPTGARTSRR
jgi:hypothetical protein